MITKIKKKININLKDYNISLQANAVRHIFKNHNLEVKTLWKIKAIKKNSATASDALCPEV